LQQAIDDNADYVWLVNNDGIALPETLPVMVELFESDPACGAVSPLIVRKNNEQIIDFCGAYHNWEKLELFQFDCNFVKSDVGFDEKKLWLVGAAILFRVKVLKEVGLLADSFFAYFEDNDICARLAFSGWKNKVAFNARFLHDVPTERPPYFYYLTVRNDFFFWLRHTPKQYRRFIVLKLLERAIFRANKLLFDAEKRKSDACLLGCLDGLLGDGGSPNLDRKVPWFMVLLRKLFWPYHNRHIKKFH
jgi:GT2 family glycosyltransferase